MTWLAWVAVLGPIVAAASGIGVGYFMGVASNADEVGELRERTQALEGLVADARRQLGALSASPPSRRESSRVLDLVTS